MNRSSVTAWSNERLPAFEGRESELTALTRFCESADDDRLLVIGARYSGKSALMAQFFTGGDLPGTVRLGYFVPRNRGQLAESKMLVHLVRQAYLLTQEKELDLDSANPGKLRSCSASALRKHSYAERLLVVDGIDEDKSTGDTMMDYCVI